MKPPHTKNSSLLSCMGGVEVLRPYGLQTYFTACSRRNSKAFLCSVGTKIHSSHIENIHFPTLATRQSKMALNKQV